MPRLVGTSRFWNPKEVARILSSKDGTPVSEVRNTI
jgi:hypothetical protein